MMIPLMERDCGPEIGIKQTGVKFGLLHKRIEPGYILCNGIVLLESERDESGCYKGGVGVDGIFLRTASLYRPVYSDDGQLLAFRQVCAAPENYLATAEMGIEQNYNQIDGIINNEAPKPPSIRHKLKQYKLKQCREKAERSKDGNAPGRPRRGQER